jgi:hypothetical protein
MQQSIMPSYFGVMAIPLRVRRDISDDVSHRRPVVIVDERLARALPHRSTTACMRLTFS